MINTIQSLAREMSQAFEGATRPQTGESFRKLRDDASEWMKTVCRQAHDHARLLPDDWRYVFIEQAVDLLAEHEDFNEALERLEPDIYTSQLTVWLHSLQSRVYFLGEALEEYSLFRDGFQLLAAAQLMEKREVFHQVLAALRLVLESDSVDCGGGDQP